MVAQGSAGLVVACDSSRNSEGEESEVSDDGCSGPEPLFSKSRIIVRLRSFLANPIILLEYNKLG